MGFHISSEFTLEKHGVILDIEQLPNPFRKAVRKASEELTPIVLTCPMCKSPFAHTQGKVLVQCELKTHNNPVVPQETIIATARTLEFFFEYVCGQCGLIGFISTEKYSLKKGKPKRRF